MSNEILNSLIKEYEQKKLLETLLSFLTTDRWELNFVGGG